MGDSGEIQGSGPSRRELLSGALTAAAVATVGLGGKSAWATVGHVRPTVPPGMFSLGVASGDPDAHSVVLWTRLAPDPLNGGGMPAVDVSVHWEVAEDELEVAGEGLAGDATDEPEADQDRK